MSPVGVVSEYGGSRAQVCGRGQRGAKQGSKVEMAPATLAREGGACFCASSVERGCVSLFPNMEYHSVNYAVKELNTHNL